MPPKAPIAPMAVSPASLTTGASSAAIPPTTTASTALKEYELPKDLTKRLQLDPCGCFPRWLDNLVFYVKIDDPTHPSKIVSTGSADPIGTVTVALKDLCEDHPRRIAGTKAGERQVHNLILSIAKIHLPQMVKENNALQNEYKEKGFGDHFGTKEEYGWQFLDKVIKAIDWKTSSTAEEEGDKKGVEKLMGVKEEYVRRLEGDGLIEKALKAVEYYETLYQINVDVAQDIVACQDKLNKAKAAGDEGTN